MSKYIGFLVLVSSDFFGMRSEEIIDYFVETWIFRSCNHLLSANYASVFLILDEMRQARPTESVIAWLNADRKNHDITTERTCDIFFDWSWEFSSSVIYLFLSLFNLHHILVQKIAEKFKSKANAFLLTDFESRQKPDLCLIIYLYL